MTRRSLMKLGSTTTDKHCGNCALFGDIAIERVTCHCGNYVYEGGEICRHGGCRELGRDFETKSGCRVHGPLNVEIAAGPDLERLKVRETGVRHRDCVAGEGDFVNVVRAVESGEAKSVDELYPEYMQFLWDKWHSKGETAPENASELFELQRSAPPLPKAQYKPVDVKITIGGQDYTQVQLGMISVGAIAGARDPNLSAAITCPRKVEMMNGPDRLCRLVIGHTGKCMPAFSSMSWRCKLLANCIFEGDHEGVCIENSFQQVCTHGKCVRRKDHEGKCRNLQGVVL